MERHPHVSRLTFHLAVAPQQALILTRGPISLPQERFKERLEPVVLSSEGSFAFLPKEPHERPVGVDEPLARDQSVNAVRHVLDDRAEQALSPVKALLHGLPLGDVLENAGQPDRSIGVRFGGPRRRASRRSSRPRAGRPQGRTSRPRRCTARWPFGPRGATSEGRTGATRPDRCVSSGRPRVS